MTTETMRATAGEHIAALEKLRAEMRTALLGMADDTLTAITKEDAVKAETWRVLIDCGAVQTVTVTLGSNGWIARVVDLARAEGDSARAAVTRLAGHCGWSAVEIRGPGEPLERESRDAIVADCAEICREVAAKWPRKASDGVLRSDVVRRSEATVHATGVRVATLCAEAVERGAVKL